MSEMHAQEMNAAAAVNHVFTVMAATYGAAWERSLGSAPIADSKTAWGEALSDFLHTDDAKRAILWGLKNLPDDVPNPRKFRTICRSAPSKTPVMLPSPKANPEIAERVISGLKSAAHVKVDHKEWAKRIIANPMGRTPTVLRMAADALGAA